MASSAPPDADAQSQHSELRAVLQRAASSRSEEHTFEAGPNSAEADKAVIKAASAPASAPAPAAAAVRRKKEEDENRPISAIVAEAGRRALGGGLPGAMAMAVQVGSLMWLRTTMNYQYRYGTSTREAMRALYKDGGILRFYRGIGPALIQGPLSRFGDTASNAGMLSLLNQSQTARDLPVLVKTGAASVAAGLFRIVLMPVDTFKTILQVEGKNGLPILREKFKQGGPKIFFAGSLGAAGATMVGHYPWFATHNLLQEKIPKADTLWGKLSRNAFIGFCSSMVSDCSSNSIRVVKTTKQTSKEVITYPQAVRMVVEKDGVQGLFLRGLGTRLMANGFQAALFTVLWKGFEERFFSHNNKR